MCEAKSDGVFLFLQSTYRLGALHVLSQQPVKLQVSLSLVAGLQSLLDACVDVLDGEDTECRVIWRVVALLLSLGEHSKEHVLLSANVE